MPFGIPVLYEDRLPPLFVQAVDRGIRDRVVLFWENGGVDVGVPVLRGPLPDADKTSLELRATELRNALMPWPETSRDVLVDDISRMLGAFTANQKYDADTALMMAMSYLWTVRQRPHWAISKGCRMVRAGTAGLNPSYCPSEPEFNQLIGGLVADYERRLAATERLLAAKVEWRRARSASRQPQPIATSRQPEPIATPVCDGNHAARAMADLQARKAPVPSRGSSERTAMNKRL
jgi:hypothetical protein